MSNPHRAAELIASISEKRDDAKSIKIIARRYNHILGEQRVKDLGTLADILDAFVEKHRKELKDLRGD